MHDWARSLLRGIVAFAVLFRSALLAWRNGLWVQRSPHLSRLLRVRLRGAALVGPLAADKDDGMRGPSSASPNSAVLHCRVAMLTLNLLLAPDA